MAAVVRMMAPSWWKRRWPRGMVKCQPITTRSVKSWESQLPIFLLPPESSSFLGCRGCFFFDGTYHDSERSPQPVRAVARDRDRRVVIVDLERVVGHCE